MESSDPIADLLTKDIILTTYEEVSKSYPLRDPPLDVVEAENRDAWWGEHFEKNKGLLHQIRFHRVVLDEAHLIRNPASRKAQACHSLNAKHKWCLTGTPCVNGAFDLWSLFTFVNLPMEHTYAKFKQLLFSDGDDEPERQLTEMLSKCLLRRTHKDMMFNARIVTLPNTQSCALKVHFNKIERAIYQIVENRYESPSESCLVVARS